MLLSAEYVLPISSEPIRRGAVLVRNGRIRDVGPAETLILRYPEEETHDYGQAVLLPGFVDVHTHMDGAVLRGIVHDVPYSEWLMRVNEGNDRMTTSELFDSAVLGCLEALSSGITTIADISGCGASVDAMQHVGMRGVVYREVNAMDKRRVDHAMRSAAADIERWTGRVDSGRVSLGIAPGALYNCHPLIYKRCAEYAGDSLPVAMHLAGSREEYNFVRYGSSAFSVHDMAEKRGFVEIPPWLPTGVTPVNYVLNWGGFEAEKTMGIHLVQVNDADIAKLKENNVSVALSPRAAAQLGMGVAPMSEFLRQDFRVGLGTDSPSATDSIDMLAEMRVGMLIQRALNTSEFLPASTMLEVATIGGARALHMESQIGTLETGKLADIIAIDISSSHQMPTDDVVSAVVNTTSGSDVIMSMVDGKVLYERSKWHVDIDVARCIAHVIEIRSRLRK
ncbi:MAG: amidohydrolase family protein [Eggerthellaceae bacterium]|nr:amidohydrolase family protein [Eggerthellaceae bacterium]